MKFSRYVFATGDKLYNSMNNIMLGSEANEEQLKQNFFLSGQERESLEARLFSKPKRLTVKIIPTWECNLRCKHCSVLHRLKKRDDFCVDSKDVIRFMETMKSHYEIEKFSLFFVGGECLLREKECLAIAEEVVSSFGEENTEISLTTNLSLDLTPNSIKLLSMTKAFDVSLDGTETQHNWQRKTYQENASLNPFKKTFFNIMRLIKLGLAEKIKVQAAIQDKVCDHEEQIKFFESLLRIGVLFKNITYGGVHPTKKNPNVNDSYINYLKTDTFWRVPCCDYRYMSFFSFNPDGSIDDDYFGNIEERCRFNISEFGDSYGIADLERMYREKIEKRMSIMNDDVCLNKCPVLSYCWGRCHNNSLVIKNPSSYCDMNGLERAVKKSMVKK